MEDLSIFFGRFHPLVVHLPIGIFMLAFLMELASRYKKYKNVDNAIPFALLIGSISASVAALLGFLLSYSGDYDNNTLWWHQWLGIGVALLGISCYFIKINYNKSVALSSQFLLMMLLTVAGHLGGNLTHGETYLTEHAPWKEKKEKIPPATSVDSTFVFQHLVQPILEKKCVSCHNAGKQKGKLRMDSPKQLLKGGKHGPILVAGNLEESELYRRVTLSPETEEFMPPDGKTPLSEEELMIIAWWIENTAHTFDKRVVEVESSEELRQVVSQKLNLQASALASSSGEPAISEDQINMLAKVGIVVRSLGGHFEQLEVTMKHPPKDVDMTNRERIQLLKEFQSQILWLNLSNQSIKDEELAYLKGMTNLSKLRLDNNPISDVGIQSLRPLKNLATLNLYNTDVTINTLSALSGFSKLEKIYAWKTGINEAHAIEFQSQNPDKQLILGGAK